MVKMKNIEVKILNKPIVSQNPISINLWLGTIFGGLFGFLIGISWILRKIREKLPFWIKLAFYLKKRVLGVL